MISWTLNHRINSVVDDNLVTNGLTWLILFELWVKNDQDYAANHGIVFG